MREPIKMPRKPLGGDAVLRIGGQTIEVRVTAEIVPPRKPGQVIPFKNVKKEKRKSAAKGHDYP